MATRRTTAHVAPKIRAAFQRALAQVEGSKEKRKYAGMSLSDIFADMILDGDIKTALELVAKFTPKEMDMNLTSTEKSLDDFINERREARLPNGVVIDQPTDPAKLN